MLDLGKPFRQYGNMCVLPDSADPRQFYYLPNTPHLALDAEGRPAIQLLVLREDLDRLAPDAEDAVAFLSFDVDVSFPEEAVKAARAQLRRDLDLDEEPKLAPLLYRSGAVRLLLLDARTPEPGHEHDPQAPSEFVVRAYASTSPSLYGDNRAIFQAMLSRKGAQALYGAFDGFTPIGVIYDLTFAGMQPAFRVEVKADWKKVYEHISDYDKSRWGFLIFSTNEVEKAVDKLFDEKIVEVVSTVQGVGAEGLEDERKAVEADMRKFIIETFFTTTLNKTDAAGGGIGNTIGRTMTDIAQGGLMAIFGGCSHQHKEYTEEQLRTLHVDWTVRRAVERTIHPQAHMSTMVAGAALKREAITKVVEARDDFWSVVPFEVVANAAWDSDGIAAIGVDIEYGAAGAGSKSWSFLLDKVAPRQTRRAWLDPVTRSKLRYRFTATFKPDDVPGPSSSVDSGWRDHEGTLLMLDPRSLFRSDGVEVELVAGFPTDRYPAVHALVRYAEPDGGFSMVRDGVLTAAQRRFSARWRTGPDAKGEVELRLRYHRAAGASIDTGWFSLDDVRTPDSDVTHYTVTDPQPDNLTVTTYVVGDRARLSSVGVEFEYVDPVTRVRQEGAVLFDETNLAARQPWSISVDGARRPRYRYRVTLVTKDNDIVETGWIDAEARFLPVGELALRSLEVEASLADALPRGIEVVRVNLSYDDDANQIHETIAGELHQTDKPLVWQVRIKDLRKRSYRWEATWVSEDGFDRRLGPFTSTDRYLVLPARVEG
ncbi:MAG: hypothetical protein U0326_21355 [Polyangiales bacterium]